MKGIACIVLLAAAALAAPEGKRDKRGYLSGYHHGHHHGFDSYSSYPSFSEYSFDHHHFDHAPIISSHHHHEPIFSVHHKIVEVPKVVEVKKVVSVPKLVSVPHVVKVSKIVEEPHFGYAHSGGWW